MESKLSVKTPKDDSTKGRNMKKENIVQILEDLKEEIHTCILDAETLVKEHTNPSIYAKANAYWLSQIPAILDGDGSMVTMNDTIKEIKKDI